MQNRNVWQRRLVVSVVAGLALMASYRWSRPVVDPDLWHEMALAREIVEIGSVPRTDSFAYTPTVEPVVHHEWGAGMIAWGATNSFGVAGIVLLRTSLSITLAALCWICARRRGATMPLLSFLAPLAIFLADEGFSTIRAHLYSFVGAAVLLNLDHGGGRRQVAAYVAFLRCGLVLLLAGSPRDYPDRNGNVPLVGPSRPESKHQGWQAPRTKKDNCNAPRDCDAAEK